MTLVDVEFAAEFPSDGRVEEIMDEDSDAIMNKEAEEIQDGGSAAKKRRNKHLTAQLEVPRSVASSVCIDDHDTAEFAAATDVTDAELANDNAGAAAEEPVLQTLIAELIPDEIQRLVVGDDAKQIQAGDHTGAPAAETEFEHRAAIESLEKTLETTSAESAQDAVRRRAKEDHEKNIAALVAAKNYTGAAAAEKEFARPARVESLPASSAKPTQDHLQRQVVADHQKKVDALVAQKDYTGAAAAEADLAHRTVTDASLPSTTELVLEGAQQRAWDDHAQEFKTLLSKKDYVGAAAAEAEFKRRDAADTPRPSPAKPGRNACQRGAQDDHAKKIAALVAAKNYAGAAAAETEFARSVAVETPSSAAKLAQDHRKRIDALIAQKNYTGAAAAETEFARHVAADAIDVSVAKAAQEEAQRRAGEDHAKQIAALVSAKDYTGAAAAEAEFARRAAAKPDAK